MARPITEAAIARLTVRPSKNAMESMRSGDLLFMCGQYPQSHVIKAFTRSPFSHVAVFIRLDSSAPPLVLESAKGMGVRLVGFTKYLETYRGMIVTGSFSPPSNFDPEAGRNWALNLVGTTKYDFDDNLSSGFKIIAGSGEVESDDDFQCAELVAGYWRAGGYPSGYDQRGFVSPDSLWRDKAVAVGDRFK